MRRPVFAPKEAKTFSRLAAAAGFRLARVSARPLARSLCVLQFEANRDC